MARETGRVDKKEGGGGNGEGRISMLREIKRVDRKEGAMGRGHFYDGMPGWSYSSRAMLGHPAS